MRHYIRASLVLVVVSGVLALDLATASAGKLSLSANNFRITWAALNLNNNRARCQVTMEGTFHQRTFTKTANSLLGLITKGVTGECEVGSAFILGQEELIDTLPWHVRYDSFTGTLPDITAVRVRVIGLSIKYRNMGTEFCLFRSTEGMPAFFDLIREAGGAITIVRFLPERTIPWDMERSEPFCEQRLAASGSGVPTLLNSATRLTLTLI